MAGRIDTMRPWRVYTSDAVVDGRSMLQWHEAPRVDVQAVVIYSAARPPYPDRFITGFVYCGLRDRMIFTGVDRYDPLGYGLELEGRLIADAAYFAIWDRAYGDSRPRG